MGSDSEGRVAATAPDAERARWWQGALTGAVAGLATGLADALLAIRSGNEVVGTADVFTVMLFYAAFFAVCGVVAAFVARFFAWQRRALSLLVGTGAALFLVGAWVNVELLDDFTSAFSIVVDLALLVTAYVWIRRRYHGPGSDEIGARRWTIAVVVVLAVGACVHFFGPVRDEGPTVHAAADEGAARPNVLLFMVDTLRADGLACYGYEQPTSPEVDAFAADATLFEDCRATTSWTKPSVASLFTSLYPTSHACVQQREILVPEADTLAEVFRAAGWRTAAFIDNPFVTPEFGFGQGYDTIDYVAPSVVANGTLLGKVLFMLRLLSLDGTPLRVGAHIDRGAEVLIDDGLLPFIDDADRPWFAYLHTMEPHLPYDPPREDAEAFGFPADGEYGATPSYNGILPFQKAPDPPAGVREALRAQYDGEVRDVSRWFGHTLAALRERGLLENTIVVFLSDHGEEFHDHGGWTHGHSLHTELLRVPLIIRVPDSVEGASAGRGHRVGGVASLLDVAPTLIDLAGIRYPKGEATHFGWSLRTRLVADGGKRPDRAAPSDRALLAEVTMGPVSLRSVRETRWHLIRAEAPPLRKAVSLYDYVSDPGETRDRAEKETLIETQMASRLDALFEALESVALRGRAREIDAETAGRLEAIGYTTGK